MKFQLQQKVYFHESEFRKALLLRADHALDLVKAFRESKT